jgi:hypothetical protein
MRSRERILMIRRADHEKLPTFLGIGAPRAGTTWLHANLRQHPEIWLTPVKEVHYFDTRHRPRRKNNYYRSHLRKRSRKYARLLTYRDAVSGRSRSFLTDLAWDLRFFVPPRTNRWYQGIFRPGPGQIAGEITPAYSILDLSIVEEIAGINQNLKIIYLLRDPISRSWSSAISELARRKGRPFAEVTDDQLFRHFERSGHELRSDYLRTLENWEAVFGRDRVFVGFLDQIQQDPADLLLRIYRFLGVSDSEAHIPAGIADRVNASRQYGTEIPERFHAHLAKLYLPQLEELSDRFGEPVTGWLRRAEESAAASSGAR